MIIFSVNSNFSFLIIPINFLLGIVISILVGMNVTFNIFLLKQIKSLKLSKRSFFSFLGMSSGLFVGCPTCAGSFLLFFGRIHLYNHIFLFKRIPNNICYYQYTTIDPFIVIMAKVLKKRYVESCSVKK